MRVILGTHGCINLGACVTAFVQHVKVMQDYTVAARIRHLCILQHFLSMQAAAAYTPTTTLGMCRLDAPPAPTFLLSRTMPWMPRRLK